MRRVRVSLSRHRIIERCCGSLSSDVADEGIDVFRARKKDKKKSCARPGHTQIVVVFFSEGGKNPMFSRLLCMRPAASAAALSVVLLPSSSAFLSSEQQQEKSRAGDFDMAAVRRAIEAYRLRENTTKWTFLDRELSSDIAGETGAVYIYAGAARALKLRGERQYDDFLEAHEAAERHTSPSSWNSSTATRHCCPSGAQPALASVSSRPSLRGPRPSSPPSRASSPSSSNTTLIKSTTCALYQWQRRK